MNNQWILGVIESQGCFSINFSKNSGKLGYQVSSDFSIKTNKQNSILIEKLQQFFKIGNIYTNKNSIVWKVKKLEDIYRLIGFLQDMPFVSPIKRKQFENWMHAVYLIKQKAHLSKEGVLEIAKLRELMHDKHLWNKQNFCQIRLDIDPCKVYKKKGELPENCRICLE